MAYTRNPTWQDYDGTDDTLITAAKLENIEQGIEDAATKADAAIPSGLVDAKGDLIVATADNTVTRLPAGTNGHVLTADSTVVAGVKWAAAAGGSSDPWTYVVATSDFTHNTNTAVNVSGMSIPALADGLYEWEAVIRFAGDNGSIGAWIGLAAAPSGATVSAWGLGPNTNHTTIYVHFPNSASTIEVQTSSSAGNLAWAQIVRMGGAIRAATMGGAVNLTLRNESGSAVVSVETDSFIRYRRIAD